MLPVGPEELEGGEVLTAVEPRGVRQDRGIPDRIDGSEHTPVWAHKVEVLLAILKGPARADRVANGLDKRGHHVIRQTKDHNFRMSEGMKQADRKRPPMMRSLGPHLHDVPASGIHVVNHLAVAGGGAIGVRGGRHRGGRRRWRGFAIIAYSPHALTIQFR